jgi:hypothetical protein
MDIAMVHASHQSYDDRLSQTDREVVTREPEPVRGWRVTSLPAPASYLRRWPVDPDRPIRPRSLSEACDNGKRAFRALADWITIYLFVLVETGRLPQDGPIECVFSLNLVGCVVPNPLRTVDYLYGGLCQRSSPLGNSYIVSSSRLPFLTLRCSLLCGTSFVSPYRLKRSCTPRTPRGHVFGIP